jgi:hypothetical protein
VGSSHGRAAGASLILFSALFDLEEQMERLAAGVIPALALLFNSAYRF